MPSLRADLPLSRCAICDSVTRRSISTRRPVRFAGWVRRYTRCTACGSRSLNPMPSEAELAILYGAEYNDDAEPGPSIEGDPRADDWLLDSLAIARPDRFVDFGCGGGSLLAKVAATGVEALGFDPTPGGWPPRRRPRGARSTCWLAFATIKRPQTWFTSEMCLSTPPFRSMCCGRPVRF